MGRSRSLTASTAPFDPTSAITASPRIPDLPLRWLAHSCQKIACRHQHARRADSALRRAISMKRRLKRRKLPIPGKSLDGHHLAVLRLGERYETGADLAAIEQYR